MKKMRFVYLDHARAIGAYLVIFGHLLPYDNVIPRMYIYSFHMALFFMISGLLHKETGSIQIKKFFITLILPVFFLIYYYGLSKLLFGKAEFGILIIDLE